MSVTTSQRPTDVLVGRYRTYNDALDACAQFANREQGGQRWVPVRVDRSARPYSIKRAR